MTADAREQVLRDGEIPALWRRRKRGRVRAVSVEPISSLCPADRAEIEAEAIPLAELRGAQTGEVSVE